jgi:hypothetical protein
MAEGNDDGTGGRAVEEAGCAVGELQGAEALLAGVKMRTNTAGNCLGMALQRDSSAPVLLEDGVRSEE